MLKDPEISRPRKPAAGLPKPNGKTLYVPVLRSSVKAGGKDVTGVVKQNAGDLSDLKRHHDNRFTFYVDDRRLDIPQDKFLEVCWGGGFDTPCSVCGARFDVAKAPPVRTLRLESRLSNVSPLADTLPTMSISNTHLDCLKRNRITFFPISHAWHQPVAEAYASRIPNPAAAKMVYELPFHILLAAAQRFGPDVQIWHDYISIPQWQDSFRGTTILPQIFQVFKYGSSAIVHLDDVPAIQVPEMCASKGLITHSASLQRLFNARWFSRMWIVIEYDVCDDAYLLNGNYEFMPNTFGSLIKQIAHCATPGMPASNWIDIVPMFVKERVKDKCLGYIYDMIGTQGCRSHRDRFIAACALLEADGHARIHAELPEDPQKACLYVSKRCLQRNDWSGLLLYPSKESEYPSARWLNGHTAMAPNMWSLGHQTRAAQSTPILQGNRITLELLLVGTVTRIFQWKTCGMENHFGFAEVLGWLVESAAGCSSRLLDDLERIYPSRFLWVQRGNSCDFPGIRYRVPPLADIRKKLETILDEYVEAKRRDDSVELKELCKEVISILGLSDPPELCTGSFCGSGRLELYARLCPSREYTLVKVQCEVCKKATLFRATLWQEPKSNLQLYHIPALAYKESLPDGMGIVVEDKHVIGRIRFGSRACGCGSLVSVQLE